jgi:hypothetical protein
MPEGCTIARFKHMTGDFTTATGPALWLACQVLQQQHIPAHMLKTGPSNGYKHILLYNNYKGYQHSFILVSAAV